jgi:phosphate-selective porin
MRTLIGAVLFATVGPALAAGDAVRVRYDEGLRFEAVDGPFATRVQLRGQFRFSSENDDDDRPDGRDGSSDSRIFEVRRARLKADGTAWGPWLRWNLEQELAEPALLDLAVTIRPWKRFGVQLGQYKIPYNRERVDSSGQQQFVERSIVNRAFTVDRQQGVAAVGRVFEGTRFDSTYAAGVYTGTGRGGGADDDGWPMLLGRWQWNFLGRELPFTQSDVARRPEAAASLAFARVANRSRFTRFSSAGGGQLEGFAEGASGRYDLEQSLLEFALHRRGLSIQGEYHWKEIEDRVAGTRSRLEGHYAQVGYFLSEAFPAFPEPLELAVRFARVSPDHGRPDEEEWMVGGNWFLEGHRNKLSADLARLRNDVVTGVDSSWRFRLQWDLSI